MVRTSSQPRRTRSPTDRGQLLPLMGAENRDSKELSGCPVGDSLHPPNITRRNHEHVFFYIINKLSWKNARNRNILHEQDHGWTMGHDKIELYLPGVLT